VTRVRTAWSERLLGAHAPRARRRALPGFEERRITSLYGPPNRFARGLSLFRGRPRGRFGRWFFAFTAASALVLASGHGAASDDDLDGIDDALELATARIVEVRNTPAASPTYLRVSSNSVGSPTNDWFQLDYEEGRFDVEYVRGSEGSLARSSFRLGLKAVVEWRDTNGNGSIERSEILETAALGPDAFGAIPIEHTWAENADGGAVHTIGISSNLNELSMVLTVAQRFYRISPERILTPMEIKIDMSVNWTLRNLGARVGIELWLETDYAPEYEEESWADRNNFSTDESAVNITSGSGADRAAVFFSWSKTATVGGRSGSVSIAGLDVAFESDAYDLILAYPQGESPTAAEVQHGAGFGVVSAAYGSVLDPPPPPLSADALLFATSVAGVAALVAATMVAAKRRRAD